MRPPPPPHLLAWGAALMLSCGAPSPSQPDGSERASTCSAGFAVGGAHFLDLDGDGHGGEAPATESNAEQGVESCDDCNDFDPSVFPGAADICDEIDNNCDGRLNENPDLLWYRDLDRDGAGNPAVLVASCEAPDGYLSTADDCDDTRESVNPSGTEVCDGVDNDCDGLIDDEDADVGLWYADVDWDGQGDPSSVLIACEAPPGYVSNATDCDDTDRNIYEGAVERRAGVDEDCDGSTADNDLPVAVILLAEGSVPWVGETVSLDGRGSYDPNGDSVRYFDWTIQSSPLGSSLILGDQGPSRDDVLPIELDTEGSYLFSLEVADGYVWSDSTEFVLLVSAPP